MPRWEPDGRERLVVAALRLFAERGYDEVTVAEIAEGAGLTRSTFFRYFPGKKDVLAAGQEILAQLLVEGIAAASGGSTPLEALGAGLAHAAAAMTPFNKEIGPIMHAAIAASAELQQRNALKQVGLASAMAGALRGRGVEASTALVAAELGGLAFSQAYSAWIEPDCEEDLAELVETALVGLATAARSLG